MKNSKYNIKDWRAVKVALSKGYPIRTVSEKTGVNRGTVLRWSHFDAPKEWMWLNLSIETDGNASTLQGANKSSRLTYNDRVYIAALQKQGFSAAEIAKEINVSRTTVSRELSRIKGPYDPLIAQYDADIKAKRPKERKIFKNPELHQFVLDGLLSKWSPRQISKRLQEEYPEEYKMRISHEAIYQAIYVQGKGSLRQELALEAALRSGRTKRVPQSKLPPRGRNKSWVEGCEISTRPKGVEDRAIPGHWEGDLIVGSDLKSCLVTLVERKTRFLVARRLEHRDTRTVTDFLIEMAATVPDSIKSSLCKSLTWDQGMEMADVARFKTATGFKVYFCDPHSPWQKGTNENTNGLIRQFFPKGTNFTNVTDKEVREMQDLMNGRPRETLNWKKPFEVLNDYLINSCAMTD